MSYLSAGNYLETAAAAVGINRTSLHRILARGAQAIKASWAVKRPPGKIAQSERMYAEFVERVAMATALSEARDVETLNLLATGGFETREITIDFVVAEVDGVTTRTEVARKEHTRTLAPSARAAMWRLERRRPEHWGRPGSLAPLTDTGAPLPSREERIANLLAGAADEPEDYLTGYADGVAAKADAK